jgi:hypothetical protein
VNGNTAADSPNAALPKHAPSANADNDGAQVNAATWGDDMAEAATWADVSDQIADPIG